ncbi:MAG TPA: 2-phospho-L-lactate transferase [Acidimicrobiia bacterium]|nr:2-phospho-L-lactate transferase [Acidimicrobiia bacterium]
MRIVQLSGGVGGARLARGFAASAGVELTVVVNVGDDAHNHGLHVSPDLDTVLYTLAGVEGPQGWGRAGDTFALNEELGRFGLDNTLQLGDRDLAVKLFRTHLLAEGASLSEVTRRLSESLGLDTRLLPATDQSLRTMVRLDDGWVGFQEYFVARRHRDEVLELRFDGADEAKPSPGVVESIETAERVIIGPSNPPLSIWPILAVGQIEDALGQHPSVVAVSPLIGGKTVKGPADRVMASLGLPPGNRGVAMAYEGLIDRLVIDTSDGDDAASIEGVDVTVTDILINDPDASTRLAAELVSP